MPYVIVATEGFKKGTTARTIGSYPSQAYAQKIVAEKGQQTSRGALYVMQESEAEAFIKSRQTGIYAPSYVEPTREEKQRAFERERERGETVKPGDTALSLIHI